MQDTIILSRNCLNDRWMVVISPFQFFNEKIRFLDELHLIYINLYLKYFITPNLLGTLQITCWAMFQFSAESITVMSVNYIR